jgi:hypothetical protein
MSRKSSRYFEAGGLTWRLPRASRCGMLYSLLFSDPFFVSAVSAGLEGDDGDAKDRIKEAVGTGPDAAFKLAASENATGAAIGLCWAASPPRLRTKKPARMESSEDLLRYGDEVMEELDDLGYLDDPQWQTEVTSEIWSRVMKSTMPSEDKIKALVGNGLSPEVTAT